MSSNNPRGKQRKNGNMQEYTTSSVQGPVPPASSTPQLMTNSTSSASISTQQANSAVQSQSSTQPQPNNLGFIMPTVDTATHPNHLPQSAYRNNPRNLSNPTMQFAPGEVHVERPQQGITTIHPRYMQQTQQTFSQTAQMANYTTAPPMSYPANVYSNVYSAQNAYPFQQQTTYYQANTPAAIPHFTQYYASAIPAGTAGGTNVSVGGVQDYMVGGRYSAATAGGNSAAAAQQLLQFSAATPQTAMAAQIQAYSTQQAAAAAACAAATQVPSSLAQVPTSQAAYSLYQPPQVTTPHPHSVSASLVGGAQPPQSAAQVAQLSSAAHAHHLQSGPAPSQSGTLQTSSSQQTPQQIQQSLVAAAAAAAAAQNQAHAAAAATHQKEKKILKIINPETQEVTNEREINAAAAAANLMGGANTGIVGGAMSANASSSSLNNSFGADGGEQMYSGGMGPVADYDGAMTMGAGAAQGGRRSAQLDMSNQQSNVITGMTTAQVTTTNASQKFSLQVAQSVLGDTNINNNNDINNKNNNNINNNKNVDSSKEDVHKEESISNDVRREQQNEEIDKNESNELKSEEAEVKPIEETAEKDEDEVDRKREKSAEPSPEIVREQERVPEKEIREESSPPKDEAKVEKEGEERSLVEGVESIDLNKEGNINEGDSVVMNNTDENINKVIVNGNEPNANDGDQHKTATHHAVEVVLEETEKEEKATSEEEDETKIERKRREFENKQAEMLKDITNVSVEMMLYSRSYLMLMRDVVKELKLKTCPVEETELKSLGIDIGTAPVVNMDRQQRRLEGVSRAFAPGWMPDNKNPLRPKQYHGRLSDRGHSQRTDRDRKRGPISRPSIDRPAREPVKLHKSENAWKHEALSQLDKDQQLYKDIRGLLNKITPSTFDVLCAKFLGYKVYQNKEQMSEVIDIIFDKAVEEPKFCPLYSDLCKKQVIEESQESGKSEFRSGILTRCQQTFETKRQDEINKKREEAAAEKDEKRQKELKIEVMEMEAKERRRMFGNIGFIGQLFRHELIVPRILNWCIIHLLKNHSEAQAQGGSDEESIECAVRMLETVGKIAEKHGLSAPRADSTQGGGTAKGSATDSAVQQQTEFNLNLFFTHLNDIASNVSNRVRFLIMNLIELRNNEWNPRKSADSGPKTIEQVHNEARKEDLMNKLQREQYEKKRGPYEGRASLDRRGMGASSGRPTIIGRQSQDGRYSARGGGGLSSVSSAPGLTQSQIENQKARAAVAANLVVSTASRKNQSLNSVDQPQSLGGGRRQFACGSAGGGQQDRDRALQQGLGGGGPAPSGQSSSSGRLSSRGSYAHRNALTYQAQHHTSMQHSSSNSRDNSQPSSREHSQSRKHSAIIDEERVSALTAASVMTHSSGGSRQRGSVGGGHNAATTNRMRSESPSSTTVGGSQNTSHPHHHHQMNSGSVQNHDELQPQHKSGDMQLQEDGEDPTAILHQQQQQQTEAALKNEKRALSILAEDLGEYFADGADIEQIYANVMEVCQTMSVRSVFRLIMTIGVEKVTGGVTNPHRRYVGQIICRCLQSSENVKQEALHGIADYCNYVVESELWEDNMRIWEFVAEIIGWSIMCDTKHFEGARPWLGDFREAFKMANGDTRQVDALFFYCIKKITEIELDRESHATSASMAYADLKELHTDALTSLLKNCKLANGENLSELLLS